MLTLSPVHSLVLLHACRTVPQAEQLSRVTDIQLALNLSLRQEVLVEKCCGRRICQHCGKNYNIADIYLPASRDRPEIVMPPLSAPPECEPHLEIREDDTPDVVLKRLRVGTCILVRRPGPLHLYPPATQGL
eukprot:GHUV01034103.1.p1 GENE.GHUV01034103.1~~GHUV01034103.1.p1  ORF type:complete len:132 (+),score=4.69 GHUV01034103.1:424-819(+)